MLILAALVYAQIAAAANPLAGLWEAKRRFGPDARGALVLQREGEAWTADFIGRVIPVREERGVLTFAIPEGSFRALLDKDGINGHWTQPDRIATPVRLQPDGPRRWRGEIAPLDEAFTFYLVIGADGAAFMRNPERNVTIFLGVNRFVRDGRAVKLLRDDRLVAEGTYDQGSDTIAVSFPDLGGTYDFKRAGDASAFYARGRKPEPYRYHPPLARDDGWPVGTLDDAHIDRAKVQPFIQSLIDLPVDGPHTPDIHAILIARHGRLVLEEYFHGENRDRLHNTRSASKSMTSILFGAAGLDPSLPVYETLGAEADDPRKRQMKAEHLLTMSSGFYCNDGDEKAPGREDTMQEQTAEPDWYRYTLRVPMSDAPGTKSYYCSANANLLGAIIARKSGTPLAELFDRLVARPLQFGRYALWLQPTGEPYMGGGTQVLARDFIKIGQLMLDRGVWRGKRVLSAEYAARATSPIVALGTRGLRYGYLWWIGDYPYRSRTVRAFMALGNGGQIVMAVPELDLVITFMGGNYGDVPLLLSKTNVYVPESLLAAVE
ncbi:MAG TPA: serine hydrolase [Thermoanaerobaculia bacterium]|nr:serine hydrolase [Thermoanaerobaculia bacterium]